MSERVDPVTFEVFKTLYRTLSVYHGYKVVGLEHIPSSGPALVVFNHSLVTYDIFLLGAKVYEEKGRLICSLADRLIFKTPGVREVATALGAVEGEPKGARRLLDEGRLVGVAPGGMREALRSSDHKYQLSWERRTGFAKLALQAQVPVVLAACPLADDVYTVLDNPLTKLVYKQLRAPLPLAFGLGPLPRPIALTTYVSPPIQPPKVEAGSVPQEQVLNFHRELTERMEALMKS